MPQLLPLEETRAPLAFPLPVCCVSRAAASQPPLLKHIQPGNKPTISTLSAYEFNFSHTFTANSYGFCLGKSRPSASKHVDGAAETISEVVLGSLFPQLGGTAAESKEKAVIPHGRDPGQPGSGHIGLRASPEANLMHQAEE